MTAPLEQRASGYVPSARDAYAAKPRCALCGAELKQLGFGRPRTICDTRACERRRVDLMRARQRGWTKADWAESKQKWAGCAFCGGTSRLFPSKHHAAPVPVCRLHREPEEQLRAPLERLRAVAKFLSGAAPFAPLPRPFIAGGAK